MSDTTYQEPIVFVAESIELLPIGDIITRPGNSKNHPPEQIAKLAGSIKEFGFVVPLLISNDNRLVAGEGRLLAAQSLGMTDLPCVRAQHLSKAQITALSIFDNKIAETGFDDALLSIEIKGLSELDSDLLGMTGFTQGELDAIINDLPTDDDEASSAVSLPAIKFGDYDIQITAAEETMLNQLAEAYLSKHKDFTGFIPHLIAS